MFLIYSVQRLQDDYFPDKLMLDAFKCNKQKNK